MTENQETKLEWRIGWGWVERPVEAPEVTEVPFVEDEEQDERESARAA